MYKIEEKCTPTRVDEHKRLKLFSAFQMMHDCDDLWIDSELYAKEVFEKEHRAQLLAARQVDFVFLLLARHSRSKLHSALASFVG